MQYLNKKQAKELKLKYSDSVIENKLRELIINKFGENHKIKLAIFKPVTAIRTVRSISAMDTPINPAFSLFTFILISVSNVVRSFVT